MSKLYVWAKTIEQEVETQKKSILKKDLAFYKVDLLPEIALRIDEYSTNCKACQDYKTELDDIVNGLSKSLEGSPKLRKNYEDRRELITQHLNESHGLKADNYYSSIYSLAGILGGAILGAFIGWIINIHILKFTILVGVGLGMVIGRLIGASKDRKNKRKKLTL